MYYSCINVCENLFDNNFNTSKLFVNVISSLEITLISQISVEYISRQFFIFPFVKTFLPNMLNFH